jgi:hypothetical protein
MPPKKATGAAAQAKEVKEKKPAAAPAHASYKGAFCRPTLDRIEPRLAQSLSRANADHTSQT